MTNTSEMMERISRRAPLVATAGVGEGVDLRCYGQGASEAVCIDTAFEIGSVTKTFTALLLADMVVRGEVSLDDPIGRYIEGAPAGVTLEDLATHTAGFPSIPRDLLVEYVQKGVRDPLRRRSDPYAGYGLDRLGGAARSVRVRRGVGRRFRYSNFGYALLGQALAGVAGRPYEQLVMERVCQPFGLLATSFSVPSGRRMAEGTRRAGDPVPGWNLNAFAPAGGVRSTAEDMARYARAHLQPHSTPLGDAIDLATSPRRPAGRGMRIGLGWLLHGDAPIIWHNGGTGGFSSFVGFCRTTSFAFVALANARVATRLTAAGLHITGQGASASKE